MVYIIDTMLPLCYTGLSVFLARSSNDAPPGPIGFPNPVLSALVLSDKDRVQDMCLFGATPLDGSEPPQQVLARLQNEP